MKRTIIITGENGEKRTVTGKEFEQLNAKIQKRMGCTQKVEEAAPPTKEPHSKQVASKEETPKVAPKEERKTIETPIVINPPKTSIMPKITFRSAILDADIQKKPVEMRGALSMQTGTENLSIVSPLLENLVLAKAGATIMDGLDPRKDHVLPVASGNPAHWRDEVGEDVSFAYTKLVPHTLIAQFEVSTQLLTQTEQSVDTFLVDLATKAMAVEIEKAVLGSVSTTTKPAGIFFEAGDLVATHAGINDMINAVESAKAKTGYFIANAAIAKTLRNTEKNGGYLLENGQIGGFPCLVSESCAGLAFGGFSDLVIGLFDNVYITHNPYTKALEGISIITITFDAAAHLLRDGSISRAV